MSSKKVWLSTLKMLNVILMTMPFAIVWFWAYSDTISSPYYYWGNWIIVLLFLILYVILGTTYDAFWVSLVRISEIIYSQTLASMFADLFMYVIIILLMKHLPNPLPLFWAFCLQIAISAVWSRGAHRWYFRCFPAKKTAIIYDMREGLEKLVREYGLEKKFDVVLTTNIDQCLENIEILGDMEAVFLSGIHSKERNIVLKYCLYNDINVYVIPRVGDVLMSSAKKMHMFHLPILRVEKSNPSLLYLAVKRIFDLVISGVALILLSPLFVITSIAIKACDGGPVFYKQERLTKNGQRFYIHKFRSMRIDAEKDGIARLSTGGSDQRITPVGHVIRRFRIDELPQLIDIIAGHLSIVGPRPERPEIAEEYCKEMPEFKLRLQVKAGLTGYAQVYGKYNTTPYDKLQMDLMYIAHLNLLEDLRICFATVKILLTPESTEGVAEGQITAMTNKTDN